MSLLLLDGFDEYDEVTVSAGLNARWTLGYRERPTFVAGRFSGRAIARQAALRSNGDITTEVGGTNTELFYGIAIKSVTLPAVSDRLAFIKSTEDATILGEVSVLASGAVEITVNGLTATSGASKITANTWHYLELRLKVDPSVGVFEVRVDTTVEATINGDTGNDIINVVGFTGGYLSTAPVVYYDDIYVADTTGGAGEVVTYAGIVRIDTLPLNGDVASGSVPIPPGFGFIGGATTTYTKVDDFLSADTILEASIPPPTSPLTAFISRHTKDTFATVGLGTPIVIGIAAELNVKGTTPVSDLPFNVSAVPAVTGVTTVHDTAVNATLIGQVSKAVAGMYSQASTDSNAGVAWTATTVDALELQTELII